MNTPWFKTIFIPIFLLSAFNVNVKAQGRDTLYYFQGTADTALVGVKRSTGEIILPAQFYLLDDDRLGMPIKTRLLELRIKTRENNANLDMPAIAVSEVYDRNGHFLYSPQYYDNGSDYFSEGLRRYVDQQKIGFVDKAGRKIIPASWDFATPFNYGYARVYSGGWKRQMDKSGEHWKVVPANKKAITYLINKKGEKVRPLAQRNIPGDYQLDGKFYPYPFSYNAIEKQILDSIRYHLKHLQSIQLEITERPSSYFPYYTVQGFQDQQQNSEMTFLADVSGRHFYHFEHSPLDEKEPIKVWLLKQEMTDPSKAPSPEEPSKGE